MFPANKRADRNRVIVFMIFIFRLNIGRKGKELGARGKEACRNAVEIPLCSEAIKREGGGQREF